MVYNIMIVFVQFHPSIYICYILLYYKYCELKGGNIGIVEKAQETRFGMYIADTLG